MTAATNVTFIFQSGRQSYSIQGVLQDAAGGAIRFDSGNGIAIGSPTTTGTDFKTFGEEVMLKDIIIGTAGTPAALNFRLTLNGVPTTQVFLVAAHLTSITFRPQLNLPVPAGARLGGVMLA